MTDIIKGLCEVQELLKNMFKDRKISDFRNYLVDGEFQIKMSYLLTIQATVMTFATQATCIPYRAKKILILISAQNHSNHFKNIKKTTKYNF